MHDEKMCDLHRRLGNMIQAYQWTFLINSAMECEPARSFLLNILEDEFPEISREHLRVILGKYMDWAEYHRQDMVRVWGHLSESLAADMPAIPSTHEVIPIEKYAIGLGMRNLALRSMIPLEKIRSWVTNEIVIDAGAGIGFWSDYIATEAGATKVIAIERMEIANLCPIFWRSSLIDLVLKDINDLVSEDLPDEKPVVLFLSEVLHGKSPEENLLILTKFAELCKGGVSAIIINELRMSDNKLFDLQMRLHTKGGRIYSLNELTQLVNEIWKITATDTMRWGPYHELTRFELEI